MEFAALDHVARAVRADDHLVPRARKYLRVRRCHEVRCDVVERKMSGSAEAVGAEIIAMPAAASIPSAIFFMKSPPLSDYPTAR